MAIEWIFVKDEAELHEAEELYCVDQGDFGSPDEYPVYGFLHADFSCGQRIEFVTEVRLETMLNNIKSE